MAKRNLKIVMYPWFAIGHSTAFLHLSNKFAHKGHQIFFILPPKTISKLKQFNLHPDLIEFIPITIPHVVGLPAEAETASDVSFPLLPLLRHAMDLTEPEIKNLLEKLRPDICLFDFTQWLPALARPMGIKSVLYCVISPAAVAYLFRDEPSADDFTRPPPGFPPSAIKLRAHEARVVHVINKVKEFGSDTNFVQRVIAAVEESDALGFKSCREMEGPFHDFLEKKFEKPILLAGPVVPGPPKDTLDEKWVKWLGQFEAKTVIYCAFGSEVRLDREQFQELLMGFELTGRPFFVALKAPVGCETVEEALPEGFAERTVKRGVVAGSWVQQQLILAHPAIGCFVTHCGWGSLFESLINEFQMVMIPFMGDQPICARLMGGDLRVGVEVEKGEEDGLFSRDGVKKAIELVMDEKSEIGNEIRVIHAKWRDFMLKKGLEDSYIDDFEHKLHCLIE